jgi:serine/threonine-protein kinase
MIHRDVNPGNIMKRRVSGDFVLLDMGCLFDLAGASLSMAPVGTPLYFSPEQLDFANRRRVLDFRSDLFSLGIVLYEMATAKHPFLTRGVTSAVDLVSSILNSTPVEPKQVRKAVPQELSQIIMRLLSKQPALRYRKTSLLIEALKNVSEGGA